ncbi:MAG: hypothetical protein U0441_08245 [Polyangiaceae bacterium]
MKSTSLPALLALGTGLLTTLMLTSMAGCQGPVYVDCEEAGAAQSNGLVPCGPVLARPQAVTCDLGKGTGQTCTAMDACQSDADCPGPNGRCDADDVNGIPGCGCVVGCATDADCGANEACLCGDGGGRCVQADCKTDADCGEGNECIFYQATEACSEARHPAFGCTTDHDTCLTDDTCGGNVCYRKDDHFTCGNTQCDA